MSKDPRNIIVQPWITEKSMALAYGDRRIQDPTKVTRSYTFVVAPDSNKIEIKKAFEAIYNDGRKEAERLEVEVVHTINMKGKKRRVGQKSVGYRKDRKKAIVTLKQGQLLEEYGV